MIQIVIFLQLVLLFAMLGATNYVKKKAKNLADKEDLKDLTLIVQKVKIGFQKVLATHRVQFEAEFRYYEDVWCAARTLHKAFVKLLPLLAGVQVGDDEHKAFGETQQAFSDMMDKSQPFIAEPVWNQFQEFENVMLDEKVNKMYGLSVKDREPYRRHARETLEKCASVLRQHLSGTLEV